MHILEPQQQDTSEKLGAIRIALEELLKTGQITEPVYFKGMVLLGARYARIGDMSNAYAVATVPTPDYYRVTQLAQMDEDADFLEAAVFLADTFVKTGMVDLNLAAMRPTQKPASA